jgi:hypothetical protein
MRNLYSLTEDQQAIRDLVKATRNPARAAAINLHSDILIG